MNKRIPFLSTKQVDLVLATPEDAPTITRWFNTAEVTAYLNRGSHPMTLQSEREYLEKMYSDTAQLMFCIWHRKDKKIIGTTGLHHINHINQTAVFGICIGEKEYWSKGLGAESLTAMLSHGFGRLNLRSVTLSVLGNNPRGKRCYEKCGFVEVGGYPKHILKDGVWHDEILMLALNPAYI
jgi:[ribosomal protein S5]-alanine N-acetyltransferase